MTETNDRELKHKTALAKIRRAKKNNCIETIHSLDHFRNTDQSELDSNEGGR